LHITIYTVTGSRNLQYK